MINREDRRSNDNVGPPEDRSAIFAQIAGDVDIAIRAILQKDQPRSLKNATILRGTDKITRAGYMKSSWNC